MQNQNSQESLSLHVIDTWLNYQSQFAGLPGIQVCIRKKGDVLFSKAYGFANLKTQRPLTTSDAFHIASHSKTFTSCAILQLVEQGKLRLLQPALDFLPELKKHKDKRFQKITLRDLLSNRSGLFRDGWNCEFWDLVQPFPSKEELLQEVLASDLIFTPNEHTKYSNIGFSLLGLVLENALGRPFDQIFDDLIFKKLKGVRLITDYTETSKLQFADGHSRPLLRGERLPLKHSPARAMAAATGFCGNAEDTSLFFDTFLRGKGLISHDLQREILGLNWSVPNAPYERYGLGLIFENFPEISLIGHSGRYPGFSSHTGWWGGTEYVASVFLNMTIIPPVHSGNSVVQNLIPALALSHSVIEILETIKETFSQEEAKKVILGGPFMNKWGAQLCLLTPKKGRVFTLDDWPGKNPLPLTSRDGETFFCESQSGFNNFGEKITFERDNKGRITRMNWGGSSSSLEEVFLRGMKASALV